jgi:hypothetical protein
MQDLRQLEELTRRLGPDAAQSERWIHQVVAYADDYLDGIAGAPTYAAGAGRRLHDSPIGEAIVGHASVTYLEAARTARM